MKPNNKTQAASAPAKKSVKKIDPVFLTLVLILLAVGLVAPVLRSLIFGMPPMFPVAVCMSVELATYGAVAGLLYSKFPQTKVSVYISLLTAMAAGRLVWGAARFLCAGLDVSAFGLGAFWAGAVTTAIPGIIVQILLIPVLVMTLKKYAPTTSK